MKAGDKLYFVRTYGQNWEITVAKVNKKWAETNHRRVRIDIASGQVFDGEMRVGMVYASEAAYREDQELRDAWSEFQRLVANRTADGLTLIGIEQATLWLEAGA
jgi:hypothetical protein